MDHEKLHNLLLTSDNWELLEELERLLSVCGLWFVVTGMLSLHKSQIFTEVTRTMSMARTPTLPWALPMYEHMRVELVDAIDLTNEPTIKAAAQAGLTKLMQYYDKALQNESNIVATGEWFDMQHVLELNNIQPCHPALCLSWFSCLQDEHKTRAITVFEKVYARYKATMPAPEDVPPRPTAAEKSGSLMSRLSSAVEIETRDISLVQSEMQRWWAGQGGKGDPDFPLIWWKVSVFHLLAVLG